MAVHDIEKFIQGFSRFQSKYYGGKDGLFEELKVAQHPNTLLIGCCDSRVDPALLLDSDPGELFVVRNIANLVPPCNPDGPQQGVSAAIQFAVEALKVNRIVVMGHAQCGGIRALMEGYNATEDIDFIGKWMHIATPAKEQVLRNMQGASAEAQRRACELAAILVSLSNLHSFPWIARRVEAGELFIHGWFFDMQEGALLAYSREQDEFLPLVCPLRVPHT